MFVVRMNQGSMYNLINWRRLPVRTPLVLLREISRFFVPIAGGLIRAGI